MKHQRRTWPRIYNDFQTTICMHTVVKNIVYKQPRAEDSRLAIQPVAQQHGYLEPPPEGMH